MPNPGIQENLFRLIRESLPSQASLVEEVAAILNQSTDSAYRRIRGETILLLDEAAALCKAFGLSLDQATSCQPGDILFRNVHLSNKNFTYGQYLEGLYAQLLALRQFKKKEVIYMSKDLPVFHNFYFRPLIAFRYFFWMKTHLGHRDFENLKFSFDLLPNEIEKLSRSITAEYCQLPSTEMWNTESINSTISQIEFSRDAGHFSNEQDIKIIYEALEASVEHVKHLAELGQKMMPGEQSVSRESSYRFFYNRVVLGDNTIMVVTEAGKSIFINYGHLNYLQTTHPEFCNELSADFENLMKRSTLISHTGERQRNIFFHIILQKIRTRQLNLSI